MSQTLSSGQTSEDRGLPTPSPAGLTLTMQWDNKGLLTSARFVLTTYRIRAANQWPDPSLSLSLAAHKACMDPFSADQAKMGVQLRIYLEITQS